MPTDLFAHRYRSLRPLGEGGMATVWLVYDEASGAEVALKVVSGPGQAKGVLQLQQEFRLAARLRHPNCCAIYDYGLLEDGTPFFTMEHVPGRDLDARAIALPQFRDLMGQLAHAIGYVHQQGLVHRDLKGGNVRVRPDGVLKLMDFGLMDYARRAAGTIVGTVGTMAPEVIRREEVDGRADLYALGCLGYELLTGRLPFIGDTAASVLDQHLHAKVIPPSQLRPDTPDDLERLLLRLLEKSAGDRPRTAADVLEALGFERPTGNVGVLMAPALIGREDELAVLDAQLAALAGGGAGSLVLLHGEAGVGKTRVAQDLRSRAQLAGVAVGTGRCVERLAVPYTPVLSALRELWTAIADLAPEAVARHAPALASALPGLIDVPPAPTLDSPAKERLRFAGAVGSVLAAVAAKRPLLLILEDWHWVDPATVALVQQIRLAGAKLPLAVVLTSRRDTADVPAWADEIQPLVLAPLAPAETHAMVAAMLVGQAMPVAFAPAVQTRTGGNPFFIRHMLEHLIGTGALAREGLGWEVDLMVLDPSSGQGSAVLRERLAGLSGDALAVARAAAVLGPAFEVDMLPAVLGRDGAAVLDALDLLSASNIFVQDPTRGTKFAHDRFHEMLYDDMPVDARIALHGAVLAALTAQLGDTDLERAPLGQLKALADHAIAAGDQAGIARFALPAGERHMALFANEVARQYMESGLAAVPPGDEARQRAYLLALGEQRRAAGLFQQAKGLYSRADGLGLGPLPPRAFASWAKSEHASDGYVAGLALCERAIHQAEAEGAHTELARALLTRVRILFFQGDEAAAIAAAERALAVAQAADATVHACDAQVFLGYMRAQQDPDPEPHLAAIAAATDALEELGDVRGLTDALNKLGTLLTDLDRPREALAVYERTYAVASEAGCLDDAEFTFLNLAQAALELGRPADCIQHVQAAWAFAEARRSEFQAGIGMVLEGTATAQLGDLGLGCNLVRDGMGRLRAIANRYAEGLMAAYVVETLALAGAQDEARAALDRWVTVAEGEPTAPILVWQAIFAGDLVQGADLAARAVALARSRGQALVAARALIAQAQIASARGDHAAARDWAEEATDLAEARGARLLLAAAQGAGGWAALALGQPGWPYFETMREAAEAAGARLPVALALHGLAVATPGPDAAQHAGAARAIAQTAAATLTEPARSAFLARPEVARIVAAESPPLRGGCNLSRLGLQSPSGDPPRSW